VIHRNLFHLNRLFDTSSVRLGKKALKNNEGSPHASRPASPQKIVNLTMHFSAADGLDTHTHRCRRPSAGRSQITAARHLNAAAESEKQSCIRRQLRR